MSAGALEQPPPGAVPGRTRTAELPKTLQIPDYIGTGGAKGMAESKKCLLNVACVGLQASAVDAASAAIE
jgi:hypothetical protein